MLQGGGLQNQFCLFIIFPLRCLLILVQKAVEQFMTELKDLKSNHDSESHVSMQRLKSAEERVKELHSMLLQKTHDLEVAQDVARKLRREYQSTRQDAEGMLQVQKAFLSH